jgi:hypothetical protein
MDTNLEEKFLNHLKQINEKLDALLNQQGPHLDGATCKVMAGRAKGRICTVDHTFTGKSGDEMAEVVFENGETGYEKVTYLKRLPHEALDSDRQHET